MQFFKVFCYGWWRGNFIFFPVSVPIFCTFALSNGKVRLADVFSVYRIAEDSANKRK